MIIMNEVSKHYRSGGKNVCALDNVSLYVPKGCFCCVVGESGSGKSTLLNIVGCLDLPSQGKYFLENTDTNSLRPRELSTLRSCKIGFIFQNFNLIKGMTALENVILPLTFAGVEPKIRHEMGMEALEKVGLSERFDHKPNELSGGQQQRVAVARAIIRTPALILADEPTGNLDGKSAREIMKLLSQLNKQGSTVLMITHDEKLAQRADKITKIEYGKIVKT